MMEDILELLPQRPENVMVDEIELIIENRLVRGKKKFTEDEKWLIGNDGNTIISASCIFETMSQFGGLLMFKTGEKKKNMKYSGYIFKIDKMRIHAHCRPGEEIIVESRCVDIVENIYTIYTEMKRGGKKIADSKFTYILTKSNTAGGKTFE